MVICTLFFMITLFIIPLTISETFPEKYVDYVLYM